MKKNKKVEQEVEKTMQALDGLEPAETDDFFYSRFTARLENRDIAMDETKPVYEFGFSFAAATILLIISLNLISISQYQQYFNDQQTDRQEFIDELATEFSVIDMSYYELDTELPQEE